MPDSFAVFEMRTEYLDSDHRIARSVAVRSSAYKLRHCMLKNQHRLQYWVSPVLTPAPCVKIVPPDSESALEATWLSARDNSRQDEGERGSFAQNAFGAEVTAHRPGENPTDRQSQARSSHLGGLAALELNERVKDG